MKKCLFFLLSIALASCAPRTEEKSAVSVMSFNVRHSRAHDGNNSWEFRKNAAVKMITELAPDLIGLQEALEDQNRYFTDNLPQYSMVGVGREDGESGGEHMTILYKIQRYDLLDAGNFWLSDTPGEVSRGWDGACNRMVTWVKLQEKGDGRPLWFFNTHLDHQGKEARREGVRLLVSEIDKIAGKGPVFITGDFNAMAHDPVMEPMFSHFQSARDEAPETDHEGTFNGYGSAPNIMVIDYIFYRKATPETFRTVKEWYGAPYLSDHYPILATFEY